MITLMVEPYCQDCCYFEADVNTSRMFAENYFEFVVRVKNVAPI